MKKEQIDKLAEKYNIDLEKLEKEQQKLAKKLEIKDSIDFDLAENIAGIDNIFIKNKIISGVISFSNKEISEQEYFSDKIRFPYIPGLRGFRELPCMVKAFNKLDARPDLIFIKGHGIAHPRNLGLASHFSLSVGIPVIGVADSLIIGEVKGEDIYLNKKKVGRVINPKKGAKPIYVSPGNLISVKTAEKLVKRYISEPHKLPEPLRLAKKYVKKVGGELR